MVRHARVLAAAIVGALLAPALASTGAAPATQTDALAAVLARLAAADALTGAEAMRLAPDALGPVPADAAAIAATVAWAHALAAGLDSGEQVGSQSEVEALLEDVLPARFAVDGDTPVPQPPKFGTKKKGFGSTALPLPFVGCAPTQLVLVTVTSDGAVPPRHIQTMTPPLPETGAAAATCGAPQWVLPGGLIDARDARDACKDCARAMSQVWVYADPASVRVNTFPHARVRGVGHVAEAAACFADDACFRVTAFAGRHAGILFYDERGTGISPIPCAPGQATDVTCEVDL